MLTGEHQSCEGIIKINCRPLEQSELRKFDKNEKILAIALSGVSKGRLRIMQSNIPNHCNDAAIHRSIMLDILNYFTVFTGIIFNLF